MDGQVDKWRIIHKSKSDKNVLRYELASNDCKYWKNSPVWDQQSPPPVSQVLPSSKSRDTKTRRDIKNPAWTNSDIVL